MGLFVRKSIESLQAEAGETGAKTLKRVLGPVSLVALGVGVIIGAAFGKIVTSLVNDILMPLIGVILGGLDFSGLSIKVGNASIKYGSFIQSVIDFLIVAEFVTVCCRIDSASQAGKAALSKQERETFLFMRK